MWARLGSSGWVRFTVVVGCGIAALLVFWSVLALAVWAITGQPINQAANVAWELLELFPCLLLLGYVVYVVRARNASGALLLDCVGLPRLQRYFLRVSGMALPIALIYNRFSSHPEPFTFETSSSLAFSLFLLVKSFTRLQIRENGLLVHESFIPWRKITYYKELWHLYPNDLNFGLEVEGQMIMLHIPNAKKQAVFALLDTNRPLTAQKASL